MLFVLTAVGGWELGMKMSSLLFYRFSFSTGGEINGWFQFFGGWRMVDDGFSILLQWNLFWDSVFL